MNDEVEVLLQDLDENDLGNLLRTYNEINNIKKALEDHTEKLKNKIKIQLKEKKWNSYQDDESKISVSLISQKKETVNKTALKMVLNEEQYGQVINTTTFEKMLIVTPKDRERMKRFVKK